MTILQCLLIPGGETTIWQVVSWQGCLVQRREGQDRMEWPPYTFSPSMKLQAFCCAFVCLIHQEWLCIHVVHWNHLQEGGKRRECEHRPDIRHPVVYRHRLVVHVSPLKSARQPVSQSVQLFSSVENHQQGLVTKSQLFLVVVSVWGKSIIKYISKKINRWMYRCLNIVTHSVRTLCAST